MGAFEMMARIRSHSKRLGIALAYSKRLSIALAPYVLSLAALGAGLANHLGQPVEAVSVVGIDFKDKVVKAGDRVVVLVTVRNDGRSTLVLPDGALKLRLKQWSMHNRGMSSSRETVIALASPDQSDPVQLRAGDSAVLSADVDELQGIFIGQVSATFEVGADDKVLKGLDLLESEYRVSFYSGPSDLIRAVWTARSPEEQEQLQPRMRELLLESIAAAEKRVPNEALEIIQYMACDAMPFLETAVGDSDPAVRRSAIYTASVMVFAVQHGYNTKLRTLGSNEAGSAQGAVDDECDADRVMAQFVKMATAALTDSDGGVRSMAIDQLASKPVKAALPAIQKMAKDPDARVRAAVQKSLPLFGIRYGLIEAAADSLDDEDIRVREQAMETLRKSAEPPSLAILDRAFRHAAPDVGTALIELMYEQEDQNLPSRLLAGFKERSSQERLAILTAIAGHNDDAALKLAVMGASDKDRDVRRASLLRLLQFPAEKIALALWSSGAGGAQDLKGLARAVRAEAVSRELFRFLASGAGSAREAEFPSKNGTQPMVSPDGRWVAYVETGWGRPGGSGGSGRSNLLSLVHAVRADGTNETIVSDMFMVGWLGDSARIASSRDAFAVVVDLNGSISAEFGEVMKEPYTGTGPFGGQAWPSGNLRSQGGVDMPHSKRIGGDVPSFSSTDEAVSFFSRDDGEDAAISPDGRWLGPLVDKDTASFIDRDGHKIEMKLPQLAGLWGHRATWSPDGRYILINGVHKSNSGPNQSMVEPVKALIIEFASRSVRVIEDVDEVPWVGEWDYRKGRWNPWARDSAHIAFVRRGQVWVSDASGSNQKQITFDSSNKVFPTFSPDGSRLAYITLQNDERKHYRRLGPTDLWVVDLGTTISARLTAPAPGRIDCLDWLDNFTLIFDRVDRDKTVSVLKTISLQ